jgi:hypothetical protein
MMGDFLESILNVAIYLTVLWVVYVLFSDKK